MHKDKKSDPYMKTDVKNNWIEQCTNLVAQLCFLLGIILV